MAIVLQPGQRPHQIAIVVLLVLEMGRSSVGMYSFLIIVSIRDESLTIVQGG